MVSLFNILFLLSSLVTGPSFMSISSLVLELWQFLFIRDWPEIQKFEIPPSEFCSISGDWGRQVIQNLAWMPPIKCYWMLQNPRVTAFTISELRPPPPAIPPPGLGLKGILMHIKFYFFLSSRLLLQTVKTPFQFVHVCKSENGKDFLRWKIFVYVKKSISVDCLIAVEMCIKRNFGYSAYYFSNFFSFSS